MAINRSGILLLIVSCMALSCQSTSGPIPAQGRLNPKLLTLKPNQWIKIHEQEDDDDVTFMRQAHGGSCFDTQRCRLILFGSNTHSKDWKNSPFLFDPIALTCSRAYPNDPPETYAVTENGLPVAGKNGNHPWATHTFGCVVYDEARDEMVVACYPGHMRPDKWGQALKHLWPSIKKHPTWNTTHTTRSCCW
jgi:hypothetical protein